MARYALRRLLWIVPILTGVTLASFALLAYVPDPARDPAVVRSLSREQAIELARSRFLDLPRFFNEHPADVVRRVDVAMALIDRDGANAELGRAELVRLGGAGLPFVLARLDAHDPSTRARVALALAPVAVRMGIAAPEATDSERAVAFWNRFWSDRSIDFRPANARRVVARIAVHSTSTRESDLLELDTYALEQLMGALAELVNGAGRAGDAAGRRAAALRLIAAAAHVTGRDDVVADGASDEEQTACARRWQEWWLVHRADFVAYDGPARLVAMLADTQYGRWAEKVVVLGFGTGADGVPILAKLKTRSLVTVKLLAAAMLVAYGLAVVLAVAAALARRAALDASVAFVALALLVVPAACAASWLSVSGLGGIAAVLALAAGFLAGPFAQLRLALLDAMAQEPMRAARARGFAPLRLVLRHALRQAMLPVVALGSVELPTALGGAFVVEKVFGITGLGEETAHAVQTHDVAWLVAVALASALTVTLTSIISDLVVATIDPRLSRSAVRHESAVP